MTIDLSTGKRQTMVESLKSLADSFNSIPQKFVCSIRSQTFLNLLKNGTSGELHSLRHKQKTFAKINSVAWCLKTSHNN